MGAIQREENLLDLQVGGMAGGEDNQLVFSSQYDNITLPQIKLERLALELNQLEEELQELEKEDIPGAFGNENDATHHIEEVNYLRNEMQTILGSDAFSSLEGKSKIERLLEQGTQTSIANALNEMIEKKIIEYSNLQGQDEEPTSFKIGDMIELNFQPRAEQNLDTKNPKMEKDLIDKFQLIDSTLDKCEQQVGIWQPNSKFLQLYPHLDTLCDKVDGLNYSIMDNIGNRAKELNKDLEDILRCLGKMSEVNYDKNKIDYLFELLEKSFESEEQVEIVIERLKALERIHKESPNIETSINHLLERQKLIDMSFKAEDQQISKTKNNFLDNMWEVQKELKEVTMLQKTK